MLDCQSLTIILISKSLLKAVHDDIKKLKICKQAGATNVNANAGWFT